MYVEEGKVFVRGRFMRCSRKAYKWEPKVTLLEFNQYVNGGRYPRAVLGAMPVCKYRRWHHVRSI